MNYLPYNRKKLDHLARKERDLLRLLERHGTEEKVAIAAEAVRASRIRALKARQSQIPECEANADRINSIDEEISSCLDGLNANALLPKLFRRLRIIYRNFFTSCPVSGPFVV